MRKESLASPTSDALLINFRLSSDAEIFVNKHRLSLQIGAKRAKTCMQGVYVPTDLPFCMPQLVVGLSPLFLFPPPSPATASPAPPWRTGNSTTTNTHTHTHTWREKGGRRIGDLRTGCCRIHCPNKKLIYSQLCTLKSLHYTSTLYGKQGGTG